MVQDLGNPYAHEASLAGSIYPDHSASAPSTIRLDGYVFAFVESLRPQREASGIIRELSPQGRYANADTIQLHGHGRGTFCKFNIHARNHRTGVYGLVVAGYISYIGECTDLVKRFNMGYGNISPKNCYVGGQSTNCKINRHVLDVSRAGGRVDLYFHLTLPQFRKTVEKQIVLSCSPPWNGRQYENARTVNTCGEAVRPT